MLSEYFGDQYSGGFEVWVGSNSEGTVCAELRAWRVARPAEPCSRHRTLLTIRDAPHVVAYTGQLSMRAAPSVAAENCTLDDLVLTGLVQPLTLSRVVKGPLFWPSLEEKTRRSVEGEAPPLVGFFFRQFFGVGSESIAFATGGRRV